MEWPKQRILGANQYKRYRPFDDSRLVMDSEPSLLQQASWAAMAKNLLVDNPRSDINMLASDVTKLLGLTVQFAPEPTTAAARLVLYHSAAAKEALDLELFPLAAQRAGLAYAACLRHNGQESQAESMSSWAEQWAIGLSAGPVPFPT